MPKFNHHHEYFEPMGRYRLFLPHVLPPVCPAAQDTGQGGPDTTRPRARERPRAILIVTPVYTEGRAEAEDEGAYG